MAKVFLSLAFLSLGSVALAGASLRFNSPLYSFVIGQPEGWIVDARSVSQIANFVVHPAETSWRTAPVVMFGRFVPRSEGETLADFVKQDEDRFKSGCTSPQVKNLNWGLDLERTFLFKSFVCFSQRKEIVAITEVPSYFGIFILSGREASAVDEAAPSFNALLEGFRWIETKREFWHPEAEDQPGHEPRSEPPPPPF